jgi:hypothetical protein
LAVQYTATIGAYEFGFDFEAQRVDVDATITRLDVGDLWEAMKQAMYSQIGIVYPPIAIAEGKTNLSAGIATYLTVIMLDNWEINTLRVAGKFEVAGGNLVRHDGEDPFLDNPLITYINQVSQAGVIATVSTGSGLSTEEHDKLMETLSSSDAVKLLIEKTVTSMIDNKVRVWENGLGTVVDVNYDNAGNPISEVPR